MDDIAESQSQQTYIGLRDNVVHVLGSKRSALYDLNARRIYWLDYEATNYLTNLIKNGVLPEVDESPETEKIIGFLKAKNYLVRRSTPKPESVLAKHRAEKQPRFAWLELGTGCNHRCIHCYNESEPKALKFGAPNVTLLLDAINQLVRSGTKSIKLIGGEPLAYFDQLVMLIDHARSIGVEGISVHSNGTLISPERASYFSKMNVALDVTVYGDSSKLHEAVTKSPGSFEKTYKGIRTALDEKLTVNLTLIVVHSNEPFLKRILEWWRQEFPKAAIGFDYTRPVGRAKPIYEQLSFTHLNRYREHEVGFSGIGVEEFVRRTEGNPCLSDKVMIDGDGIVSPCIMLRKNCGSLADQSLGQILNSRNFSQFRDLTLDNVETCKDCEFRYACSDCRPISIGLGNGMYGKPPECKYNPYKARYDE